MNNNTVKNKLHRQKVHKLDRYLVTSYLLVSFLLTRHHFQWISPGAQQCWEDTPFRASELWKLTQTVEMQPEKYMKH